MSLASTNSGVGAVESNSMVRPSHWRAHGGCQPGTSPATSGTKPATASASRTRRSTICTLSSPMYSARRVKPVASPPSRRRRLVV